MEASSSKQRSQALWVYLQAGSLGIFLFGFFLGAEVPPGGSLYEGSMSYLVLARKWRPQTFADILGQKHITRTLQNAIQASRVGHAYLFVGSRGIGKTTTARIFAKALNCANPQQDADGRIEPCCECQACREIAAGNCLDVIEIDGASHNKVEDVREICENVQYAPTNGRKYKIYIIDEVHMLTVQAWNALLKTLEEPPAHVKFLFATTEAHKVLATILSRTQRFDLKRLSVSLIVKRLREIADQEKIFIDEAALAIIARAAEGGMRDAQSIFDQMIAFCGGLDEASRIREEDVINVFGLTSQGELQRLQAAMLNNDPGTVIEAVHNLADKGRDLERLYGDLLERLRNLMVFQVVREPAKVLELTETEIQDLQELARNCQPQFVQRLVEGMLSYGDGIRNTLNKRLFLEATLLKVMQDAHAVQIDDLIARLRQLQQSGGSADLPGVDTAVTPASPLPESTSEAGPAAAGSAADNTPGEPQPRQLQASTEVFRSVKENPFVQKICNLFDGRVVDARG